MLIYQKKKKTMPPLQYQWKKPNSAKQTGKWLNNVQMNPSGNRYWFWVITRWAKLSYLEPTVVLIDQGKKRKKRATAKIPIKPVALESRQRNSLRVFRGTQMEIGEWHSLQRKPRKVSVASVHFPGDSHKPRWNSLVVNPSKRGFSALSCFFQYLLFVPVDLSWAHGILDPRWSVRELSLQRVGF